MDTDHMLADLRQSIIEGDESRSRQAAERSLQASLDPLVAVERGLSAGMREIGDRFERGEVFLPEMLMAAEAFKAAMDVLEPEIQARQAEVASSGTVLLSTVRGDVHNIGKNIVGTVLETSGFKVVDAGVDNPTLEIVERAESAGADIIALSSLMTTTMPAQREVIETLKEMNLRDRFAILVGGGPVNQEWAQEIGADGYGKSAIEAAAQARALMEAGR
jgi:trimethylamine corrinoid protein